MSIAEKSPVFGVENLGNDERQRLLVAVEKMLTTHHGSDWSTKVDYGNVDYMQANILAPALALNLNAIMSDLNKEATLADLDYLFLLYETIENDIHKKELRRGSVVKPFSQEPLPKPKVDIEDLLFRVYAGLQVSGMSTEKFKLPEIPAEVKKFINDTDVADLALLLKEELSGLERGVGGIIQPTAEFWHMVEKLKNRHTA